MSLQDFKSNRLPEGLRSIPARAAIGAVILIAVTWIVIGLIALRIPLTNHLQNVFYTQLIVLGSLLIALANRYLTQLGGFNRDRSGQIWQVLSYGPVAFAVTAIMGVLMLLWPVWTSFSGVEPNKLLQVMFLLITIGLCGTFAGYVSLADVARIYRHVPLVLYVLIALLAAEVGESLWRVERLEGDVTGMHFGRIAYTVAITVVVYALIAIAIKGVGTERSRIFALVGYLLAGSVGFGLAFGILLDSLEAGPHRFVLGAAMLLASGTVGLTLLHYYNRRPLELSPQPKSPAEPGHSGEQEPAASAADARCSGCRALLEPAVNFCRYCGLRVAKGQ